MAAYAALVSLNHTIEQIRSHPQPPISLDQQQVESFTEIVTFLQGFLEGDSHVVYSKEGDGNLESRIADAAYAAEDLIESHVVDQIDHEEMTSSIHFRECLKEMIEEMGLIKNKVMEIIEKKRGLPNQMHKNSTSSHRPISRSMSLLQTNTVVGFDDLINETLEKLTGGQSDLQIIRVVGMGGIGKTTLAQIIYEHQTTVDHFDLRLWVTISQEYRIREIILELLQGDGGYLSNMDECKIDDIGTELHQKLFFRRYFIIMDDIWDDEVWDQLKLYFPNNENGSRVMFTTRLSNLLSLESNSHRIKVHFLDEENSWNLFCKIVFGREDCPENLKKIGRKIAESCKGLPLSINVIGGLLAKSTRTEQHWTHVAENFNSIVNLEDGEYCLQILYMSYNSLPVYLKPCFLYMGIFGENTVLNVSELIKLWDAEGLLKPDPHRSSEEVAQNYLRELVDRNLIILVEKAGNYDHRKLKSCKMHDLLRDLCLREARKEKFFFALGVHSLSTPQDERRICINQNINLSEAFDALQSAALARSLIWELEKPSAPTASRLLRVFSADISNQTHLLQAVFQRVNLRYVNIRVDYCYDFSSFSSLWNLRTLIVHSGSSWSCPMPSDIWKMSQLRHVKIREAIELPDPPTDTAVLKNLEELLHISNFKCSDEAVDIIPNIKRFKVPYGKEFVEGLQPADWSLHNLGRLHKLESLGIRSYYDPKDAMTHFLSSLSFPRSLKKLTLEYTFLQWKDMTTKVGPLPFPEVLKLKYDSFIGFEWETLEGQFRSLKFLVIDRCHDLESWITDSSHFPSLEHLVLGGLQKLREIPREIGDIDTLKSIEVENCSESAVLSAIIIRDEQENSGNELQVVIPSDEEEMNIIEERTLQRIRGIVTKFIGDILTIVVNIISFTSPWGIHASGLILGPVHVCCATEIASVINVGCVPGRAYIVI